MRLPIFLNLNKRKVIKSVLSPLLLIAIGELLQQSPLVGNFIEQFNHFKIILFAAGKILVEVAISC
ncbi:unnamed protein product [Rodentolepis nana]|uniref:Uncharacterized protein n=1 Tax=Rodentolepis nana TaxID=102285 RepID=A0A0R3T6D4_RODNA|nr:unnamed protein product [Rodentolepis nana]